MRKYWEMTRSQLKLDMAYKAWWWAGMFSTLLALITMYAFWHAVYQGHKVIGGMSLNVMLTYVVMAMLLGFYMTGVGNQLASNIRDGSVAIELMRPYDLLHKLMALDLGSKLTNTVQRTLPMLVISFLFLQINRPADIETGVIALLSSAIGVLIGGQFDLIVGILSFWTINAWGVRVLRDAILLFFTGSLIPISLFPHWLQAISQYLPFQSMVYVPVSIYTGQLTGVAVYTAIAIQLVWLLSIYGFVRGVWAIAIRKVTIFGG